MLEAIRERAQGWLAKVILALLIVPFALWGVDSYFHSGGGGDAVAVIDDEPISSQEFSEAMREQSNRMREMVGPGFDPSMIEQPEFRTAVLDNLINRKIVLLQAEEIGIRVSDAQVAALIAEIPVFQDKGKFSKERYEAVLRSQGLTPQAFEVRVRQELLNEAVLGSIAESVIVPRTSVSQIIQANEQQREVAWFAIPADEFKSSVAISAQQVKAYYDRHKSDFMVPERVKVQYLVLSPEVLGQRVAISDEDIRKYYESHREAFAGKEERRASHILVAVAPEASEQEKKAAHEKALALAEQAKKEPARFAELAEKNSEDTGSAQQGGDLGYFDRGTMVKPFEDAVFSMKPGDIRGPIETDFGFHVIQLTDVKKGATPSFETIKPKIAQTIRDEKSSRQFLDSAENFSNLVYEQGESLKPAADALGLSLQTSGWITRTQADNPLLESPKLRDAIFSDEVLKDGRNTEAVEVAPNTLVAARVTEHQPAQQQPLAAVEAQIKARLEREAMLNAAKEKGAALLAELKAGKAPDINWAGPQLARRGESVAGMPGAAQAEAFKLPAGKNLPAYGGVATDSGYTVVKVTQVIPPNDVNGEKRNAYSNEVRQLLASEYARAYVQGLKNKAEIEIKKDKLNAKE